MLQVLHRIWRLIIIFLFTQDFELFLIKHSKTHIMAHDLKNNFARLLVLECMYIFKNNISFIYFLF